MAVNLEVGIDASGVVKGSREAFQALVQLTNATRHLMDGLEAMNGANGAMGRFGMLMSRASPYIMAATAAMGAISLAMNVFSDKTNDAADAQKRLAEEIAAARKEQELARSLGESTLPGAQAERAAVRKALGSISGPVGLGDFSKANGVPEENILRWLATRGDEESLTMLERGSVRVKAPPGWWATDNGYRNFDRSDFGQYKQVSPEQQKAMLEARYRVTGYNVDAAGPGVTANSFNTNSLQWYRPPADPTAPTAGYSGMGPYLPGTTEDAMTRAGAGRWQGEQSANAQEEVLRRQLETMREVEQVSREVGATLGSAATQFVFQLASGREILAGLVMQMAQAGLTQAFTAGARGIFGAFNAPAAQRTPGVDP